MKHVYDRVKELVLKTAELDLDLYGECELNDLSVSSLQYIVIIVALEREFSMEFDDECLRENYFESFDQLTEYIVSKSRNMELNSAGIQSI